MGAFLTYSVTNTLRLQAEVDHLLPIREVGDLRQLRQSQKSWLILGERSNVVLPRYFDGTIVLMQNLGITVVHESQDTVDIRVEAGENWHELVKYCLTQGWYGLENLALIPGSVGAAPVQNIGAYGVSLSDHLLSCQIYDVINNEAVILPKSCCQLGYRTSIFKQAQARSWVITSIVLRLSKIPKPQYDYIRLRDKLHSRSEYSITPQHVYEAVVDIRKQRLPDWHRVGTAGSFFVNPVISMSDFQRLNHSCPEMIHHQPLQDGRVKLFAGNLLQLSGWQGYSCDGLRASSVNPMVLINEDTQRQTQEHLLSFARRMIQSVDHQWGVVLEIEPSIIGGEKERKINPQRQSSCQLA